MSADAILKFLASRPGVRIALTAHVRPDGDAVGSCWGLAHLLRAQGWHAVPVNLTPIPPRLQFLFPEPAFIPSAPNWHAEFDCLGVLDCGVKDRLDAQVHPALDALPVFTLDHHETGTGFGPATWIDPRASSVGEMVVRLAQAAGWPLPQPAAQALWASIVSDTGCFCYENTTPTALRAALACLDAGAKPAPAARQLFGSSLPAERRLQAVALQRMQLHAQGRISLSWITQADFAAVGADKTATSEIINLLRDMAGVQMALFLYETDRGDIKVSMRSVEPYSCLKVVTQFGGGGHERAAGATISGPMDEACNQMLDAAKRACNFTDVF